MEFFTSDHHFWHRKIHEYCGRPWSVVEEMNEVMVSRWNAVVKPEDTVYHLGDFCFGPTEKIAAMRARLNGKIILTRGNHDRSKASMFRAGFDAVYKRLDIALDGYTLTALHDPDKVGDSSADYILCGHVHESWKSRGNIINVGVDKWDFTPVSWDRLLTYMKEER
jgi:calcineurin-like phosphoesterase family protein